MRQKPEINTSQKTAIEFKNEALLVVAGAGTGKTRVITERIKCLIEKESVKPQEILALTFTEKASQEMLKRIEDIMPLGYEEPWVYTFHSFADRILREEGLEIGLDTSYKILTDSDQWVLFRENLFKFNLSYFRPLGNPTKFIYAILKFISRLKDEDIKPEDLEKYAYEFRGEKEEKQKWEELAHVYKKYEELKVEHSKMDFGDLITWSLRLFNQRKNILRKYQKQFKHILIDEFQDTNYSQYELIKLLFPANIVDEKRSLLVVGDDSQSIYKFRGAAVSNILEFKKDYPLSKTVSLIENYRSTQSILDSAYKLIKNNDPDTLEYKLGISKKLKSQIKGRSIEPQVCFLQTAEDEVEFVISKILQTLAKEPQYTYKDFAILARANNHLDVFILSLRKYGLPYQLVGNRGLYDREEVRDILALLKIVINPLDSISLYRVLNISVLNIPLEIISQLLATAKFRKQDLWEIVRLSKDKNVNSLYEKIIEFQKNVLKQTPVEMVFNLVNSTNYINQFTKRIIEGETIEDELCIKNLNLFLEIIKRFEISYRQENKAIPTIIDFVDYINLLIEAGENPAQAEIEDIDTINLLTVHASKGLEFPVVFMVGLVSDRFPTRDRKDTLSIPNELIKETLPTGDEHIQEERRLFYVGMTRTKKYLYLTSAKNYGGKRDKVISGFVNETGLKIDEISKSQIKEAKTTQAGLFGVESGFRNSKVEKVKEFVPDFLSYTQISTYETCPLQYKYSYVLKIPTPPNHALSFGTTIHNTLKDFHEKLMFDKKLSLNSMLKIYEEKWEPLGYLDNTHRDIRFESGKKLLENYYKKNVDKKAKIIALEKSFNLKIAGTKFYGRIDRIDELSDGGVEIIDYKTGNPKTQKEVDKDDQVAFYALGAIEALDLKPKKLSLYFVESGEKISTTRTKNELEQKKEEIKEVVAKIKSGNFEATPGMPCTFCAYKEICPYAWKG